MARRREPILLMIPWWGILLFGLVSSAALIFLPRAMLRGSPNAPLGEIFAPLAYLVLAAFLIGAIASATRSFLLARRFDELRGLDHVRRLSWQQFEMIVGEAFRRQGYSVAETGRGGAVDGIDLVLKKGDEKYFVQCKHWKVLRVGVRPIRELAGIISTRRVTGGLFVSSGAYTNEAIAFARESGIELIDGTALEQMVVDAQMPEPYLEATARNRRLTEPFLVEEEPSCPTCGSQMVKRTAKRGTHAGTHFWGCSTYPECNGIRDA